MSRSREEIVAAHKGITQRLEAVASGLSKEDLARTVYPGWTVRGVLCHLAAGSGAGAFFVALARAGRPGMDTDFDLDKWNERQVAERRSKPVSDLLAEFQAGHETSVKAVQEVSDDLLAREIRSDVGTTPLAEMLYLTAAEHDGGHLDDLEKALRA